MKTDKEIRNKWRKAVPLTGTKQSSVDEVADWWLNQRSQDIQDIKTLLGLYIKLSAGAGISSVPEDMYLVPTRIFDEILKKES